MLLPYGDISTSHFYHPPIIMKRFSPLLTVFALLLFTAACQNDDVTGPEPSDPMTPTAATGSWSLETLNTTDNSTTSGVSANTTGLEAVTSACPDTDENIVGFSKERWIVNQKPDSDKIDISLVASTNDPSQSLQRHLTAIRMDGVLDDDYLVVNFDATFEDTYIQRQITGTVSSDTMELTDHFLLKSEDEVQCDVTFKRSGQPSEESIDQDDRFAAFVFPTESTCPMEEGIGLSMGSAFGPFGGQIQLSRQDSSLAVHPMTLDGTALMPQWAFFDELSGTINDDDRFYVQGYLDVPQTNEDFVAMSLNGKIRNGIIAGRDSVRFSLSESQDVDCMTKYVWRADWKTLR